MQWTRTHLPKSRAQLEQFVKDNGLHPYGVADYKGREIFLAETELELDRPEEHPWGYYQTAWFVTAPDSNEKMDGGSWLEFAAMHDLEEGWTQEAKHDARIEATIQMAIQWIDKNIEVGRYNA